ncbi:MAG: hypothetical protein K940chlam3_00371 [Chlamydiae bacterium]|nr:hypothetical protein [Chlamydiota bacterium]
MKIRVTKEKECDTLKSLIMKRQFPIFQSHLDLAHQNWAKLIDGNSLVIDATCGNGYDSEFLASLKPTHLYCLDLQQDAIDVTKSKLNDTSCSFFQQCHSCFPNEILENSVKLVVYNLGYLPGGNKNLTTKTETTLLSLKNAMGLLVSGGVISITCYPGHEEGTHEGKAILKWSSTLDPSQWSCCVHTFTNRKKSPSLILIQKSLL